MGALIMAHSDDEGLVLPPLLAPIQVVIVPIFKTTDQLDLIEEKLKPIIAGLKAKDISAKFDHSDKYSPGFKFAEYELKGIPLRIAIGARDLENGTVELARRDTKEKSTVPQEGLVDRIENLLKEIQDNIYQKALAYRTANTLIADDYTTFKKMLDETPGFILAHWDGTSETEEKIKEETKATIRCVPLDISSEAGVCMVTGKPSAKRVLFARAY